MDALATTTDVITNMLVPLFLIVGIGLAVGTLFTNHNRKKKDDQINRLVNFAVPAELEKLPTSDYLVMRKPWFMTKLGRIKCDYLIISTHGIYLLQFGRINGYVDGKENESGWKYPKLMGFSSQRFTSPLWRAKIVAVELRKLAANVLGEDAAKLPCYPMAVFPAETRLCDALQEYDFVEDEDDEDEYEYVDEDYEGDDVIEDEEDEYDFIDDTRFVGHPTEVYDFITWHQGDVLDKKQMEALRKLIERNSEESEDAEVPERAEGEAFPEEYRSFTANYHTPEEIALNQARGEAARAARKAAKKQGLKGEELEAAVRAAALAVTMDDVKAKAADKNSEGE